MPFKDPVVARAYQKWYRKAHPDEVKLRRKAWCEKNKEHVKQKTQIWRANNRAHLRQIVNKSAKKQTERVKSEIYRLLGRKCAICGADDTRVLQIHHVFGGGRKEIAEIAPHGGYLAYYKYILAKLKSGSKEYQLLCANCNIEKAMLAKVHSYSKHSSSVWSREHRIKYKQEIFDLLGNRCAQCGFADERALQVDHVKGGGCAFRKAFICGSYARYYKHILKELKSGSKDYQILCANCNRIKMHENQELNQYTMASKQKVLAR